MTRHDRSTDSPMPAGKHLADKLDARGWTQLQFAGILDRPVQFVCEVVCGKKGITRKSAAQIGAALGTTPEFWLNLQHSYQLWHQRQDPGMQAALFEIKLRAKAHRTGRHTARAQTHS